MLDKDILINNIDKIHTTALGIIRISKNLGVNVDVVSWCKSKVLDKNSTISLLGKNWYIRNNDNIITINKYSYTIITAHKEKAK